MASEAVNTGRDGPDASSGACTQGTTPLRKVHMPTVLLFGMRTVFHVSTAEQLSYVDAKVRNLLEDGTVDVDHVAVVLDAPGPIDAAADRLRDNAEAVIAAGAAFEICSNAARGATHSIEDLPDGAERVASGVGELTRLQDQGYAYIRL